jgi:hypothetical protein
MFCGGEGGGNAGGLLAFGTMAGFRADLNALEIRSKCASPKEPRTSSEKGEHKGDESLARVQPTTDSESF